MFFEVIDREEGLVRGLGRLVAGDEVDCAALAVALQVAEGGLLGAGERPGGGIVGAESAGRVAEAAGCDRSPMPRASKKTEFESDARRRPRS